MAYEGNVRVSVLGIPDFELGIDEARQIQEVYTKKDDIGGVCVGPQQGGIEERYCFKIGNPVDRDNENPLVRSAYVYDHWSKALEAGKELVDKILKRDLSLFD